jgi:hypothetical protein
MWENVKICKIFLLDIQGGENLPLAPKSSLAALVPVLSATLSSGSNNKTVRYRSFAMQNFRRRYDI